MGSNREQPLQSGALPSQAAECLIDAADLDRQLPRPQDVIAPSKPDTWTLDSLADLDLTTNEGQFALGERAMRAVLGGRR